MEPAIDLDNPEFRQVEVLLANTRSSVFMTGKAGTGKSTFLRHITSTTRKKFVVLAPTGIAAVNAGGQTLHSFFHLPLKPLLPDDVEFSENRLSKRMKYSRRFIKLLRELELIIIDEISMVRADVIDFIDKILRHYCPKFANLPFGGKQLLMVGDVYQLEPVAGAAEREIIRRVYPNFYFFSAKVFSTFSIIPIELRKVYRQTDSAFVELLDRVRDGSPLPTDLGKINARVEATAQIDSDSDDDMVMTIATRREIVSHINDTRLESLPGKARKYCGKADGDFPETSFPTDKELLLKEGAQVVFIRNDQERRWVNGTIGRVVSMEDDEITIRLENGKSHSVEREQWANVEYSYNEEKHTVEENVKGTFTQFPIKLAWALTIHKSQGLTFQKVRIDVGGGAFAGGQSYVALSRCTSLEGISMVSPMRPNDIYVAGAVRDFARSFNNPALLYSALENARADQTYTDAYREFAKGHYRTALELAAQALGVKPPSTDYRIQRLVAQRLYALSEPSRRLEQVVEENRRMREQLNALADEYVQMGNVCLEEAWDQSGALSNFNKALSLNPDCYEARLGKARALLYIGEREAAVDILRVAARDFKRFEASLELGVLYLGEGDLGNASIYLEKAKKLAPKEPVVYEALADVADAMDDPVQAERYRAFARGLRKKK